MALRQLQKQLIEKNSLLETSLNELQQTQGELILAKEAAEKAQSTAEAANQAKSEFLSTPEWRIFVDVD